MFEFCCSSICKMPNCLLRYIFLNFELFAFGLVKKKNFVVFLVVYGKCVQKLNVFDVVDVIFKIYKIYFKLIISKLKFVDFCL